MIRVGIVGASGYTGSELLRALAVHPQVKVEYLSSRTHAGQPVSSHHPGLLGWSKWVYEPNDPVAMASRCDVVFTAVPHGAAMDLAPILLSNNCRLVDLGTDFRFRDVHVYEEWYHIQHTQAALSASAAYGLPELFRSQVQGADIVGNPGCYPTSALLALAPLVKAKMIELDSIIINSMSGVSGAGATPKPMSHFPNCTENAQAYGTATHRHTPEIEQGLSALANEQLQVQFTPHLIPMSRGILTTAVAKASKPYKNSDELIAYYQDFYQNEPFIVVLDADTLPQTKAVWGSNFCHVTVRYDARTKRIIAQAVIDNLVKGAAGQAIQNMNVLFGLDERTGLFAPGLMP